MVPLDSMWFESVFFSLFFSLFSNKAEIKDIRRQNKTLSATVLKLTKTVQQLEDENQELKKELTQEEMSMMDSPVCRAKGIYIYKGVSWTGNTILPNVVFYKQPYWKDWPKPA